LKYASAGAFRRALETRLAAHARDTGLSVVRLRKEVAFDRLLARLFVVAPDRWVLKGALALDYRFGDRARATKDVDLVIAGDETSATADLLAAQATDLSDFFALAIERTAGLDRLIEGAAVRYHVRAELAGRIFDEFVLDVGFDPPAGVRFDRLRGPDLLAFADIAPVEVFSLPLEFHVAEKLHAYSRGYGAGALVSTRVKDLLDLALIPSEARLDARRLHVALEETFERRASLSVECGTPDLPRQRSDPRRLLEVRPTSLWSVGSTRRAVTDDPKQITEAASSWTAVCRPIRSCRRRNLGLGVA
jgi:predicted nucleotidyltransferase component of viral defense system